MADIPKKVTKQITDKFVVSNNTFSRAVKDNPKDKIELEIGDSKQPDFKPQAKLMRWGEVNSSFRFIDDDPGEAEVKTEGKVIKYVKPKKEVHFYELDPNESFEDGGLEIEILLKEKPSTNLFEFSVSTKGLNFFYQPPLTQEEKDQGAIRDEEIEGSYAVYHKTKGGMNDAAGMEYKVGKAYHIPRPFAYDANGMGVFCDLSISIPEDETQLGILTVTVPQDFLDNAVYPVVVDPTFGYTSQGASSAGIGAKIRGAAYSLSESATTSKITAYLEKSGTGSTGLKTAIYSDAEAKVAESSEVTSNPATGWIDFTLSTSLSSATFDLLAYGSGADGFPFNTHFIHYDSGSGHTIYYNPGVYTSWPASFTPTSEFDGDRYSIYATYTATGGGAEPPKGYITVNSRFWGS